MSDAAEAQAGEVSEIEATPAPAQQPQKATAKPESNSNKVSAESLWEDKVSRLNADLHKERQELKKLRAERDELAKSVSDFTIKEKKSEALNAALSNLGEDFEISSDKLPTLNKLITKIADSETLAEDIAEAVSLVKSPKARETAPLINTPFGGPATASQKSVTQMSAEERMALARNNPDQFKKLMNTPFGK